MTKNKKKEEKNAFQNWMDIYNDFRNLNVASRKAYSEDLEQRMVARKLGVDIVTKWMGKEVSQHPEFNARAPQNVIDQWVHAGIDVLDAKYQGNIENNWTAIMKSVPGEGLEDIVLGLPPVEGIKKYKAAAEAHESFRDLHNDVLGVQQRAGGDRVALREGYNKLAEKYLVSYEEDEDEDGKKKYVVGEIEKKLLADPDIKVRGKDAINVLREELESAALVTLAVSETAGERYVGRVLEEYSNEFDKAVGKDKEMYARQSLSALKADKKYKEIGFALGQIKDER